MTPSIKIVIADLHCAYNRKKKYLVAVKERFRWTAAVIVSIFITIHGTDMNMERTISTSLFRSLFLPMAMEYSSIILRKDMQISAKATLAFLKQALFPMN